MSDSKRPNQSNRVGTPGPQDKGLPGKRSAPQFFKVDAVFEEEIEKAGRALDRLIRKAEEARLKAKTDVD